MLFNLQIVIQKIMNRNITHLDLTTLYGAALVLDESYIKEKGLSIIGLLNLSQFIEAIVLNDKIQYERGQSTIWNPYIEAIDKSILHDFENDKEFPLIPFESNIDDGEEAIVNAVKWSVKQVNNINPDLFKWVVECRKETYNEIETVKDKNNNFTRYYLDIARNYDKSLKNEIELTLRIFKKKKIDIRALHTLIRLKLLSAFFSEIDKTNYLPHYSRQPLIIEKEPIDIKNWSVRKLIEKRNKDFKDINSYNDLGNILSPIFIACLNNIKRPKDIIENALLLRSNKHTRKFQKESIKLMESIDKNVENRIEYNLYKMQMNENINNLNDFLLTKLKKEHLKGFNFSISIKGLTFGWNYGLKKVKSQSFSTDSGFLFLSNIYKQSLGIINATDAIEEVFNTKIDYDRTIFSCIYSDFLN